MSLRSFLAPMASIAILAAVAAADAQPRRVQVGNLSCSVSAGIGLIVASQRNVNCNFQPDNGPPEAYTGTMTIIGVDVGFTTGSAIVWGVFTDTNRFTGMLTGTYVGATAQATAIAGVGANALVGGSNHSVSLQPLSVQGQVGLNAAGGIGNVRTALRAVKQTTRRPFALAFCAIASKRENQVREKMLAVLPAMRSAVIL